MYSVASQCEWCLKICSAVVVMKLPLCSKQVVHSLAVRLVIYVLYVTARPWF